MIDADELSPPKVQSQTVLDAIRALRPQFLNQRGNNSQSDPEAGLVHVSIDNGRINPLSDLNSIHVSGVVEIRFLSVTLQAMQKFGGAARQD